MLRFHAHGRCVCVFYLSHIKRTFSSTSHQHKSVKMHFNILLILAAVGLSAVSCAPVNQETLTTTPDAPSPTLSITPTVDVETPCVSEVSKSLELEENVDECSICLENPSDPMVSVNYLISTDNFMQTYILQSLYRGRYVYTFSTS
jgi:hypothetical protein